MSREETPFSGIFPYLFRGIDCDEILQVDDSPTQADGNRLGPVTGAQFIHDVFDMDLDRFLGDEELLRDVPIAVSPGNLAENLYLPVR